MPIYKSSSGWMYKCCINSHQYCKRGFKTKKEAELAEAAFKLNFKEIKTLNNIKLSLALKNYYLNLKDHRSSCTFYHEQLKLNKYVLNYFGDINLSKFNQKLVMSWYYYIDSLKVTISYKNHLLNSFKNFCKYLSFYYNFDFSIIERLYTFSDYSIKTIDLEEEKGYLDLNEFKKLLNSIDDKYWKLYLCLSFFLGLRIGELKALRNDAYCINHKYKALIVYRQLVYAGKGKQVPARTKSKTSDRVYYLPNFLYEMLMDHIKFYRLKENDYIFFSSKDKKIAISSTTIRRRLEAINSGLCNKLNPHKFRHSAATNLFENGALKEDIKNFLGHESSSTTMNIYIHKTKDEVDRVNNVLEDIFNKIKE